MINYYLKLLHIELVYGTQCRKEAKKQRIDKKWSGFFCCVLMVPDSLDGALFSLMPPAVCSCIHE